MSEKLNLIEIQITSPNLWCGIQDYSRYPTGLAKLVKAGKIVNLTNNDIKDVFEVSIIKDKTGKSRKHGVTENVYGIEHISENKFRTRGLNLFKQEKGKTKEFRITKEGLELGNSYLYNPTSIEWKIKLIELLFKYDIRLRTIIILQNKLNNSFLDIVKITKGKDKVQSNSNAIIKINDNEIFLLKESPEYIKNQLKIIIPLFQNYSNLENSTKKFLKTILSRLDDCQINKNFYSNYYKIMILFNEFLNSLLSFNEGEKKISFDLINSQNFKNKEVLLPILEKIMVNNTEQYFLNVLMNKHPDLIVGPFIKKKLNDILNNNNLKPMRYLIRGSRKKEPSISVVNTAYAMAFQILKDLELIVLKEEGNHTLISYNFEEIVKRISHNIVQDLFLSQEKIESFKTMDIDTLFIQEFKKFAVANAIYDRNLRENEQFKIRIGELKKVLMKNLNMSVEKDFEDLFKKNLNKTFKIIRKRIGLPSDGIGLNFDPGHRIYIIEFI